MGECESQAAERRNAFKIKAGAEMGLCAAIAADDMMLSMAIPGVGEAAFAEMGETAAKVAKITVDVARMAEDQARQTVEMDCAMKNYLLMNSDATCANGYLRGEEEILARPVTRSSSSSADSHQIQTDAIGSAANAIANILSSTGEGTCAPCKQIFGQHEPRSNKQLDEYYFGDTSVDGTDMDIDRDNYTQLFCGYEDMPGQENKSWAWRIPPQGICVINNLRPSSPGQGDFWADLGESIGTTVSDAFWTDVGIAMILPANLWVPFSSPQHNFAEDGTHFIEPQSSPFFVANKFECEALGFQYSDNKLPIGYGEEGDSMVPKNYEYYPLDHDSHIKQSDPSPSPGEQKLPDIVGNYLKRKYSTMAKKDSYLGESMNNSATTEYINAAIDEGVEQTSMRVEILEELADRWEQWSWGTVLNGLSFGRFCAGGTGKGDSIFGDDCESWDTKEIVRQKFKSTNVCNSDDFVLAGTGIDNPDPNAISNTAGLNQCGYKQKTPNHCCPKIINSQNCPLFQNDLRIIPSSPPEDGWTTNWINDPKNQTNSSHCYDIFEFPWTSEGDTSLDSFFTSNGGISCHKRDGSSAVVDRNVSISSPLPDNADNVIEYSFVDVNRPISDNHITSLNLDEQPKGSYWGTRAKIDSTHPYKENSDSGATGYEHYIDPVDYIRLTEPREGDYGWSAERKNEHKYISQNTPTYIVDYQNDSFAGGLSETERERLDSWSFSKSTRDDIIGDAVYGDNIYAHFKQSGGRLSESPFTRYSTLNIDPNITDGSFNFYSCQGEDQRCSDLEKTQYIQQIYDKMFCKKYPDNLLDEETNLNKFYRPVGINNQGENISSPNKLNYPDICCDNIENSNLSAFIGCDAEGQNPYFIDDIINNSDEATIPTKETCATSSTGSSPCENWTYGNRERIRGGNINYNQCNKYVPRTCYGINRDTSSPDFHNKDCYYKIRNFFIKNKYGGQMPGTEREQYLHPGVPTGQYPDKSCIDECKTNACGTGPLTDPVESCGACEPYSESSPSCFPGADNYPVYYTDNYLREICETDYPEIKGTNCVFNKYSPITYNGAYVTGFVPRKNKEEFNNWNTTTGPSNKFGFTIEQPFDSSDDVSPVYNECVGIPTEYNILDIEIYDKKIDWAPDDSSGNIRYVGSSPPNDLPIKVKCKDEYDTPIISSPIKDPSKDIYYYDVRCPSYNHSGRQDQDVPTLDRTPTPGPSPPSSPSVGGDNGQDEGVLKAIFNYILGLFYKFLILIGVPITPYL